MPEPTVAESQNSVEVVPKSYLVAFVLTTFCFALWGFANDITNPLVEAFGRIFNQSNFASSFVQFAFYGGYCFMALPAALFIKKFSYKTGLLVGLALYALGGLAFIPAASVGEFMPFLIAFFVMTCGLSFLETSANPYILSMGPASTATQRLNLAQSFNPLGSIVGILTAKYAILSNINALDGPERAKLPVEQFDAMKFSDLAIVRGPYVAIGLVIVTMFVLILVKKMPHNQDSDTSLDIVGTLRRLFANSRYVGGVIAQAFYVGAQIMCWTFTAQYGKAVYMAEGLSAGEAAASASSFTLYSMVLFAVARFVCTFLLKYVQPGALLLVLATGAMGLLVPVMLVGGQTGLWALVGVSGCMSLMFPTIYGIALDRVGDDAKLGAAGLVMAIAGGSIMPPLQGYLIDTWSLNLSFVLPLVCFGVIAIYGLFTAKAKAPLEISAA
ncbi:Fucose permease [Rhodopirellula islandica]|uniref:Fucose permease n=1 Tax=Rhodopirellula islandica TaxID=595434 RepID=A0A0J1BK85_RHOIS|nr:L-fucose:H+ symporter permease [Rhodopirellula islandica]KLU06935.1 Fucose permease [Rhodopirellula islandica]